MTNIQRVEPGTARKQLKRPNYLPEQAWDAAILNYETQEEQLLDDELPTYEMRWAMVTGYALGWRDHADSLTHTQPESPGEV